MFEDILGKPNPIDKLARDLFNTNKNTIVVCPECGVEMMSLTINDDEEFKLVDCDFPCRQCSEDPTEILKWLNDTPYTRRLLSMGYDFMREIEMVIQEELKAPYPI